VIVVLDNRDSFVHNIARYLRLLGGETLVVRSDTVEIADLEALHPTRLIVSPGPGRPEDAGVSMSAISRFSSTIPTLGICLGHQCIGEVFGWPIVETLRPYHGVAEWVEHTGRGLFEGLPNPLSAARYHSLTLKASEVPEAFEVSAWTGTGDVMAIDHRTCPIWGVQFHPESVLTPAGEDLLRGFLRPGRFR
jgi:anthranilate synthase/aminodeoxychorismate synthase-like glutamine amidotransferase